MKKNEFSEMFSNLLIVGELMQQGGVMIDQVTNYVSWLVS